MTTNGFIFEEKEYTFPLNEKQKEEFQDIVSLYYISANQKLSEKFIREFQDKVNWILISRYQKLSKKFIKEFQDKVNWDYISIYQKLSKKFIIEFQKKVHWNYISGYQKLSEKFIIEFQDKVSWDNISVSQKLSEEFIREFQDKVHWDNISGYQNLSDEFREEFKLGKIKKPISIEEYAKKHNLEIKDGYLYAFRDHNFNGSGIYRKNIYYEKGKAYKDWHCDLNPDHENSYGLGVFPKGNTAIKVKVEDWGTGVRGSDKGRVWEFEVL